MGSYVVLDGYEVRRTTEKAAALVKEGAGFQVDLIWVPRSCMRDGDTLETGDTDLECVSWKAEELGLDF
jgi:hypothetical protein